MIQGWCLSPARIHVQGACGSYIVLPCVPSARPLRVTGDRLRRQDDEPRPACTCVQRCQCHCSLETLSAAEADVRRVSRITYLCELPDGRRPIYAGGNPESRSPSRRSAQLRGCRKTPAGQTKWNILGIQYWRRPPLLGPRCSCGLRVSHFPTDSHRWFVDGYYRHEAGWRLWHFDSCVSGIRGDAASDGGSAGGRIVGMPNQASLGIRGSCSLRHHSALS